MHPLPAAVAVVLRVVLRLGHQRRLHQMGTGIVVERARVSLAAAVAVAQGVLAATITGATVATEAQDICLLSLGWLATTAVVAVVARPQMALMGLEVVEVPVLEAAVEITTRQVRTPRLIRVVAVVVGAIN